MSNEHQQESWDGAAKAPSFFVELLATIVGLALVYGMIAMLGNGQQTANAGTKAVALMEHGAPDAREQAAKPGARMASRGAGAALAAYSKGAMRAFAAHKQPRELPAFSFLDEAGRRYTLADLKGKVVLLNLWATWCGPCRHEMPALDELKHKFDGRPFEVLTISIDRGGLKKPRRFFDKIGVKHLTLYGQGGNRVQTKLRAIGMPTTLLIDAKGFELGRLTGAAEWAHDDAVALIEAAIGGKG